ncbi:zinc finger protein Xfin [Anabrus simplex]|uniref:zinc finger protein Xfin n=1 Tax=Anabrus simplex TaxID=316456 RepID=UPI0035A27056
MNVPDVPGELPGDEVMAEAMNELEVISLYSSDGEVSTRLDEELPDSLVGINTTSLSELGLVVESDPSGVSDGEPLAALVSVTSIDPATFEKQGNERNLLNDLDVAPAAYIDSTPSVLDNSARTAFSDIVNETKASGNTVLDSACVTDQVAKSVLEVEYDLQGFKGNKSLGLKNATSVSINKVEILRPVIVTANNSANNGSPAVSESLSSLIKEGNEKPDVIEEEVTERLLDNTSVRVNGDTVHPQPENEAGYGMGRLNLCEGRPKVDLLTKVEPDESEFQEDHMQESVTNLAESLGQEEQLDLVDETISGLTAFSDGVIHNRTVKETIICPDLLEEQEQLENVQSEPLPPSLSPETQHTTSAVDLNVFTNEEQEELLSDVATDTEIEMKPRIVSEGRVALPLRHVRNKTGKKVTPRRDLCISNTGVLEEAVDGFNTTPDSALNENEVDVEEQFVDPLYCSDLEGDDDATGASIDPLYCSDEELPPRDAVPSATPFTGKEKEGDEEVVSGTSVCLTSLRTRIRERPYKCTQCNQRFSLPSALTLHLGSHTGEDPYACEECGRTFSVYSRLVNHRKTHKVQNKCYECGLCFVDNSKLQSHVCIPHMGLEDLHHCHECGETFDDVSKLDRHIASHVAVDKYTCPECGENFTNRPALLRHTKNHRPHKCGYCHLSFADREKLSLHVKTHAGPYKCSFCGKTFPERYRLVRHEKTHVRLKKQSSQPSTGTVSSSPYKVTRSSSIDVEKQTVGESLKIRITKVKHECGECGKDFPNAKELESHLNTHKNVFQCGDCKDTFNRHALLLKHYHAVHSKKFNCKECGEKFSTTEELMEHRNMHEVQKKPHRCNNCGERFSERSDLIEHLVKHNEELEFKNESSVAPPVKTQVIKALSSPPMVMIPFSNKNDSFPQLETSEKSIPPFKGKRHACIECDRSFSKRILLIKHMRMHAREKKEKCRECSESFVERDQLVRHIRLIHTRHEAPFNCQLCHRSYPERHRYNRHLKTHLGNMPFQCDQCNKKFPEKYLLNIHYRTHTGERPFKCTQCNLSFTMRTNLNSHIELHHNTSKSYKCHVCGLRYHLHNALIRHLKMHASKKINSLETSDVATDSEHQDKSILESLLRTQEGTPSGFPYSCKFCSSGFNHYSNLSRHVRNVHKCKMDGTPHDSVGKMPMEQADKNPSDRQIVQDDKGDLSDDNNSLLPSRAPRKCKICRKVFSSRGNVYRHMRTVHRKSAPTNNPLNIGTNGNQTVNSGYCHKCPECGKLFNARCYLKRHMNRHAEQKLMDFKMMSGKHDNQTRTRVVKRQGGNYKCPECGKVYTEKCNLRRHFKNSHFGRNLVFSEVNEESVSDNNSLANVTNSNVMHECPECGKCFHYSNNLRRHMQSHSALKSSVTLSSTNMKINEVEERTSSLDIIDTSDVHVSAGVVEELPYKCKECGKDFGYISSFRRHMKTHTLTMLSIPVRGNVPDSVDYNATSEIVHPRCDLCDRDFQFVSDLNRHMKMKHRADIYVGDEVNITCKVCEKKFEKTSDLQLHMLEHGSPADAHVGASLGESDVAKDPLELQTVSVHTPEIASSERQLFECKICGKKFEMKAQLNGHSSTHLFKCKYCGKQFVNKFQLTRHFKTYKHSKLLPYECKDPSCRKKFPDANRLNMHMKLHAIIKQEPERNDGVHEPRKVTFPTMAELHARRKIRSTVYSRPYQCELCGKHFPNNFKLNRHLNAKKHARPMMNPVRGYSHPINRDILTVQKQSIIQNKTTDNTSVYHDIRKPPNVAGNAGQPTLDQDPEHTQNHIKNKPILFSCKMCNRGFVHESVYRRHMNTKRHFHMLSHECKVCYKRYVDGVSLNIHLATHSLEKTGVTEEGSRLIEHSVPEDPEEDSREVRHPASEDGEKDPLKLPSTMDQEDGQTAAEQAMYCEECGKHFFDRIKYNRHVKNHLLEKKHKCKLCGLAFHDVAKLRRHMQTQKHTTNWPFRCKVCGDVFADNNKLYRHTRLAHGTPISCQLCGKRFVDNYNLNRHLRTQKHNLSLPHTCRVCGRCFTSHNKLRIHSFKVHGPNAPLLSSDLQNEDSRESNFSVSQGTGESAEEHVYTDDVDKHHEQQQLGSEEFTGDNEGSLSPQQQQEQQQQQTTPNFPFLCKVCGKGFYFKSKLNRHSKTHLNRKLYECPECGLGYNNELRLQKHITTHFDTRANVLEDVPSVDEIPIDTIKEEPLEIEYGTN